LGRKDEQEKVQENISVSSSLIKKDEDVEGEVTIEIFASDISKESK